MKPERDPILCEGCGDPSHDAADLVATPAGALCQTCADELAKAEGWSR